jgi:hypothetical protein
MKSGWKTLINKAIPRQGPRPVTPPTPEGTTPPANFYTPIDPDTDTEETPRIDTYPIQKLTFLVTISDHEPKPRSTSIRITTDMMKPGYKILKDLVN